jgi:hypothetical protein
VVDASGWKGMFLTASIGFLAGVPSCAANSPVAVQFQIARSGCAAATSGSTFLSIWHAADYPGFGSEVTRIDTLADNTQAQLKPGYYRVMISGRGCWEEANYFSLLPGLRRTVRLHFASSKVPPGGDIDEYDLPAGAIAGMIPATVVRVQIVNTWFDPAGHVPQSIFANIQGDAYYADIISTGTYTVRAFTGSAEADATETVSANRLSRVDFSPGDFRVP